MSLQRQSCDLSVEQKLELVGGLRLIDDLRERLLVPDDVFPMIGHDSSAEHRRGGSGHEECEEQEDYGRRSAAKGACRGLCGVLLVWVLHIVDRRRLVEADVAATLLAVRSQILLIIGVVQAEYLVEVILVR